MTADGSRWWLEDGCSARSWWVCSEGSKRRLEYRLLVRVLGNGVGMGVFEFLRCDWERLTS